MEESDVARDWGLLDKTRTAQAAMEKREVRQEQKLWKRCSSFKGYQGKQREAGRDTFISPWNTKGQGSMGNVVPCSTE